MMRVEHLMVASSGSCCILCVMIESMHKVLLVLVSWHHVANLELTHLLFLRMLHTIIHWRFIVDAVWFESTDRILTRLFGKL